MPGVLTRNGSHLAERMGFDHDDPGAVSGEPDPLIGPFHGGAPMRYDDPAVFLSDLPEAQIVGRQRRGGGYEEPVIGLETTMSIRNQIGSLGLAQARLSDCIAADCRG